MLYSECSYVTDFSFLCLYLLWVTLGVTYRLDNKKTPVNTRVLRARDGAACRWHALSTERNEVETSNLEGSAPNKTGIPVWDACLLRARDGTRTRGLDLGKVALHQLSHSRMRHLPDDKK